MMLKFCPHCKGILIPVREEGRLVVKCKNCGRVHKVLKPLIVEEDIKEPEERGMGIARGNNKFATYKHVCEKCGYRKAEVIDLGAQYSDEDELILLRCGRCGHSERTTKKSS